MAARHQLLDDLFFWRAQPFLGLERRTSLTVTVAVTFSPIATGRWYRVVAPSIVEPIPGNLEPMRVKKSDVAQVETPRASMKCSSTITKGQPERIPSPPERNSLSWTAREPIRGVCMLSDRRELTPMSATIPLGREQHQSYRADAAPW